MTYLATINVPGYLPQDDDPPTFDTAREAWEYLRDERTRGEDDELESDGDGYSATKNTLDDIADNYCESTRENYGLDFDGTGTVHGDTPGGRMHDLGLSYTVSIAE